MESESIKVIRDAMIAYRDFTDLPITNLEQVFTFRGPFYPHDLHRRFRDYGKSAGFTDSFYEKYVFFPSGLTNPGFSGELLLMNAKPYPGPNGIMQRQILSQAGNEFYRMVRDENYIQNMFREMGIQEPKAVPMPRPPPPPPPEGFRRREPFFERVSYWFFTLTSAWGVTQQAVWLLLFLLITTPLLLLALLTRRFWRRSLRNKNSPPV